MDQGSPHLSSSVRAASRLPDLRSVGSWTGGKLTRCVALPETDVIDMDHMAKPTVYRGITFRSALEAGWAATMDSLGIVWLYEPWILSLPSGQRYRPDFHLPEIRTWLEVKGPHNERVEKPTEWARLAAHRPNCPTGRQDLQGVACCDRRWSPWELVILGREPAPLWPSGRLGPFVTAQGPPGLLAYESTVAGDGIGLAHCEACSGYYFFRLTGSFACRRCGAHDGNNHFQMPRVSYVWA